MIPAWIESAPSEGPMESSRLYLTLAGSEPDFSGLQLQNLAEGGAGLGALQAVSLKLKAYGLVPHATVRSAMKASRSASCVSQEHIRR